MGLFIRIIDLTKRDVYFFFFFFEKEERNEWNERFRIGEWIKAAWEKDWLDAVITNTSKNDEEMQVEFRGYSENRDTVDTESSVKTKWVTKYKTFFKA